MPDLPAGTVTFLFTDIEGSTRLVQRLRDRYGAVLGEHQTLLRAAFGEHRGREVDTQGDSFFVAFPRARDAVAAAVAAQRALTAHSWPEGSEVRVRMGIHTGEPAVGDERYVGLGVHRAARIAAAGHGGQVLLSNTTRELVEDELPAGISLRDLGQHRLKDLDRPERIFQLAIDGLPSDFPPLKTVEPVPEDGDVRRGDAFVGREGELRQLLEWLREAESGRGRLALVSGEPGIGKSRLAGEVARRAGERDMRVVWGRCWEAGGAPVYWPWVQAIRALIRELDGDALGSAMGRGAADIAQMLPELRDVFPDLPSPASVEDEGARFRLFDSTTAFLRNVARGRPLVLVVDDLHAADTPSLLLLQFLGRELADARILVVASYRDVELGRDHPLAAAIAQLAREQTTRLLPLGGLGEPEVARLIELTTSSAPEEALVAAVHRETEGNPFFVGEVVRLLATEGRLDEIADEESWMLALPEGVREVIGQRLRHLSDECERLLAVASVIGREFRLDTVARASGVPVGDVLELLDEALTARVVTEVPGALGRFRFSHALIRDTLYDELPLTTRVRLHARVGEVLESVYVHDPDPHLSELAHHFFHAAAGGAEVAVDYCWRAGERAARLLAFEEAARLFRMVLQALELRDPPDDGLRCDALLALGDAQARGGDTRRARETFLEAAAVARRLASAERLARAALGYGGRFVWDPGREDPHLVPLLEEAAAMFGESETILRSRVLARLGGGPLRDDVDRTRRLELTGQAVDMARRLGDPATLAYALASRVSANWAPDNPRERIELATESLELASITGDRESEFQAHHWRCLALLELGEIRGVYEELEGQGTLAEELRQPAQRWYVESVRGALATFQGRFDEAERLIPELFELGRRAHGPIAKAYMGLQLYALRRDQGQPEEARATLAEAAKAFPTYRVLECALAHAHAELESEAEAREAFDRLAADDFAALPFNDEWLFGMTLVAEVAEFIRDARRVETIYTLLAPYAELNAVSAPNVCIGSVARVLGRLAASTRRWDDAERHFEAALEMNARTEGRPWLARTQEDYARMHAERGRAQDRTKAVALASSALAVYSELGMDRHAERVAAIARDIGTAQAPA